MELRGKPESTAWLEERQYFSPAQKRQDYAGVSRCITPLDSTLRPLTTFKQLQFVSVTLGLFIPSTPRSSLLL